MPEEATFLDLIKRVRAGDDTAASKLMQRYEPQVRRLIRVRLTDPAMRRQMDSVDICQSVMGDFFARAALGQFELATPEDLIKLLATMARNKLLGHVRKQHAGRRSVKRLENAGAEDMAIAARTPTASRIVSGREMLQHLRSRLTDDERYLADQRALGRSWAEIAQELGAQPDALRMKLSRALDRVAPALGLNDSQ
jgi:RNA polymerase sigma-70 factor (ECF subfamily)